MDRDNIEHALAVRARLDMIWLSLLIYQPPPNLQSLQKPVTNQRLAHTNGSASLNEHKVTFETLETLTSDRPSFKVPTWT